MGAYKPLLEIGGVSVARRVVGAFAEAGVTPIVVVTGHNAAELEKHLSEHPGGAGDDRSAPPGGAGDCRSAPPGEAGDCRSAPPGDAGDCRSAPPPCGLLFVTNGNYATTTMYESAKLGLSFIRGRCARTFFCPIDVPLFTPATVRRLMASDAPIVKPVYNGKEGHPILIDAALIPELIAPAASRTPHPGGDDNVGFGDDGWNKKTGRGAASKGGEKDESQSGAGSLKTALVAFESVTVRVEVDDEGILYDADTPEDMKLLTDMFSKLGI
jgi:CTP:molybdopterin cytidylyltransferase MocA